MSTENAHCICNMALADMELKDSWIPARWGMNAGMHGWAQLDYVVRALNYPRAFPLEQRWNWMV